VEPDRRPRENPVEFTKVLSVVTRFLDEDGVPYALAGAFALAAYGLSRATEDIDFVVDARAQRNLIAFLESLGYETTYSSEGYSNHVHPLPAMGRVDCIYVGGSTATQLFEGARVVPLGDKSLRVPRPEHLAAMKILAMRNDPTRTFQEMADLQHILGLPGVDVNEVRGYFERYGLLENFDELRRILDADRP
jgi:hypothetical protein